MNSTSLTSHDISIAGVSLRLKTSHDEQILSEILELVNKRIDQEVANLSPQKALVLACLRLAEDLYVFRQNTSQELNHIENLANRILSDLQISHL
ncbi:MAG: cell division protein ZapA [Bdellovibrionales bacterium]|nr:cell division protein ZapA [Bdellovibrionales bacterium]